MATNLRELLDPAAVRAGLDPIGLGEAGRAVAARPLPAVRSTLDLATGSSRAVAAAVLHGFGVQEPGPAELPELDRRYADPAWEGNAWYFLCRQQHALFADYLQALAGGVGLTPRTRRKIDFLVQQAIDASAPVNWP